VTFTLDELRRRMDEAAADYALACVAERADPANTALQARVLGKLDRREAYQLVYVELWSESVNLRGSPHV